MANDSLVDALFDKLRVLHPTRDHHDLLTTARIFEATGMYTFAGQRIIPKGTAAQLARAKQEDPALVALLAREHVGAVSSSSPLDRVQARLQAMGSSIEEEFGAGSAPVAPRGAERARAALSSPDPLTRARARMHLMGVRHDDIGGFDDDPEAA